MEPRLNMKVGLLADVIRLPQCQTRDSGNFRVKRHLANVFISTQWVLPVRDWEISRWRTDKWGAKHSCVKCGKAAVRRLTNACRKTIYGVG